MVSDKIFKSTIMITILLFILIIPLVFNAMSYPIIDIEYVGLCIVVVFIGLPRYTVKILNTNLEKDNEN